MDQLTSRQLSEWEAYDKIDPIGTWREDFRWAGMTAHFVNLMTWAHGKKGSKHDAMDFMPEWDTTAPKEVKVQSLEDMKRVFQEVAKTQNKKVFIPTKPPKKR